MASPASDEVDKDIGWWEVGQMWRAALLFGNRWRQAGRLRN
jgi:hypothetical protein